jgi:hypothetical protein
MHLLYSRRPALARGVGCRQRQRQDGRVEPQRSRNLFRPPFPRKRTTTIAATDKNNSSTWLSQLRAKPPAAAAALTGAYALIAGGALVAAPATTLAVLAPAASAALPPGWIRLGGLILATFGAQYTLASYYDCRGGGGGDGGGSAGASAFYRASVPSRLALAAALALLVASGQVERGVLILAALNATGSLSMRKALAKAKR